MLDIEGTTTPIDFVYQTLFPYARTGLAGWLREQLTPEDRDLLMREYEADSDSSKPLWRDPPTDYLLWLMELDRKQTGLKLIQGKIWKDGYLSGELRGDLFPDVAPAMKQWHESGKKIAIFSSGSVQAQQLLFTYSVEGDLSGLISHYFDTELGPKRESASYSAIAARIGCHPRELLFISDIGEECQAASQAGVQVLLAVRPRNKPQAISFPSISTFADIQLQERKE